MNQTPEIVVVGGGITGMTIGALLSMLGYEVTIYAEEMPLDHQKRQGQLNPAVSSYFPAASIIPHSMNYDSAIIERIFAPAQRFWSLISGTSALGVRLAKNLEVFCDPVSTPTVPSYVKFMEPYYEQLPDSPLTKAIQSTFPTSSLAGYGYVYYLAQMDWYAPILSRLFRALGGKLISKKITIEELQNDSRPTILAAGIGSTHLAARNTGKTLAGHLILLDVTTELQQRAARLLQTSTFESFDLSPPPGAYDFTAGKEKIHGDLYMYLRAAGTWVLGGSRIPCEWQNTSEWQPAFSDIKTLTLNRCGSPGSVLDVPEPIWSLNTEIISNFLEVDITKHIVRREAALGLRYLTQVPEVGTEVPRDSTAPCLAYYGYGGSGVTCSWGVAFDAAKELQKRGVPGAPKFRLDEIAKRSGEFLPIVQPLQNLTLELLQ